MVPDFTFPFIGEDACECEGKESEGDGGIADAVADFACAWTFSCALFVPLLSELITEEEEEDVVAGVEDSEDANPERGAPMDAVFIELKAEEPAPPPPPKATEPKNLSVAPLVRVSPKLGMSRSFNPPPLRPLMPLPIIPEPSPRPASERPSPLEVGAFDGAPTADEVVPLDNKS